MAVQIRDFEALDLERMIQITVEAFEGVSIDRNIEVLFGRINGRDWRWRKQRQIELDAQRGAVFVADIAGRLAGYITTWVDAEAGIGYIPNLAVDAEYRNQGVGRRLIEHALDYFRARRLMHARIETLDQNAVGQTLYPSCGFVEVARQIHYSMPLGSDGPAAARKK